MNPTAPKMAAGTANYSKPGQGADVGKATTATPITKVHSPTGQEVQLGQIGRSGTYIYSGIISNEDYNVELTRFEGIRRYEIMRRSDSTIAAMLDAVKLPIESTNWKMSPASEKPQAVEAADYIRRELFGRNIKFSDVIQNAGLMLDFGYSVMEKVLGYTMWKPDGGESRLMVGLDDLQFRKHRSIYKWETSEDLANGILKGQPGITQYVPGGTYSIPMDKLCVFSFRKEGDNYEGMSLLRRVYKDWDIKDKLILINAIRHERQGLGIIQVIAPEGANQEDIDRVIASAQMARSSESAVFQSTDGFIVEFMDMKAGSGQLTNIIETIEYHDKQILLAVLAQFIMLGQKSSGGGGSRATSEDQSKLFELGLESIARNIANTIQDTIVKPLCDMNFSNLDGEYPRLEFDKIGDDNLAQIGEVVSQLMGANALTADPDLEQSLRTLLHLPDLPEDYRKDYTNRLQMSGSQAAKPAATPEERLDKDGNPIKETGKPQVKDDGKDKGNTQLTAGETALDLLRQTKEAALELLASEHKKH